MYSPQIHPRGRISIHGLSQPLPRATWVQATRVSIATVPIRLASSPGSSRTPTVRRNSSERVPSGKSGCTTGGGSGTTGIGEGDGTGGEVSVLLLQPTAA